MGAVWVPLCCMFVQPVKQKPTDMLQPTGVSHTTYPTDPAPSYRAWKRYNRVQLKLAQQRRVDDGEVYIKHHVNGDVEYDWATGSRQELMRFVMLWNDMKQEWVKS